MFSELSILVEPFERIAIETVGVWYLGTLGAMFLVSLLLDTAGIDVHNTFSDQTGYWEQVTTACIAAPIVEELIFRVIPTELGWSLQALVVWSIVWALLHGKTALVIVVTIPLYLKLVLGGFYAEAILLHALHNLWAVTAVHFFYDE